MISPEYAQQMARYNRWQNSSVYEAATSLTDAQRRQDTGAFFGSIHATLNHLVWADQMWMHRFAGTGLPLAASITDSVTGYAEWQLLREARVRFDDVIDAWTGELDRAWLEGDLTWFSGATGRELRKPKSILVMHMFIHQTHHRGQVHCMLTQLGAKPADTDLAFMPG
ncbi:MAG TPA: DinB family protein [Hyphomicrobiaceae bacterium]|nr:DinB family protein [Hyphomicrobiaceae bacterium]